MLACNYINRNLPLLVAIVFMMALTACVLDGDHGNEVNENNNNTNNNNGNDGPPAYSGSISISVGDTCSGEVDLEKTGLDLGVGPYSDDDDESFSYDGDILLFSAAWGSQPFELEFFVRTNTPLDGPPMGSPKTVDESQLVLTDEIGITCGNSEYFLSHDDENTAEDRDDLSVFNIELSDWNLEESAEYTGDQCSADSDAGCRSSVGTLSMQTEVEWTSAGGDVITGSIDVSGVNTLWIEAL